jgi:NAD(P)H-dependent flavin oxidoreductase YrpB (nitropropane dioxygenase family)
VIGWAEDVARGHLEVAFAHPIRLLANALGSPPVDVIERAHTEGIKVAALAGKAQHAQRHVNNGVDVIVAQGYEAGGHTGDVATMVLVPDVVDAIAPVPVLAAGGIGSGRQIAAAMSLGAQGVWLGSLWLTTAESNSSPEVLARYLEATSNDTVRSRSYTGKPARMLRNAWTDAWEDPAGPGPLGMPLQNILTADANARIARSHRKDLAFAPVGQVVGRMNTVQPVRDVMYRLVEEYIETVEALSAGIEAAQA